MHPRHIIPALCLAALSCSEAPVDPMTQHGPSIAPGVGSTFTYRELLIDRDGGEVPGTSRTVTATVVDNDASYAGRSGLTLVADDSLRVYYHYEPGGDVLVSVEGSDTANGAWVRLPISTLERVEDPMVDSTTETGERIYRLRHSIYENNEVTITPAGRFFAHMTRTMWETIGIDSQLYTSARMMRRWYVPSLGIVVRTRSEVLFPEVKPYRAKIRVLTGYSLK